MDKNIPSLKVVAPLHQTYVDSFPLMGKLSVLIFPMERSVLEGGRMRRSEFHSFP